MAPFDGLNQSHWHPPGASDRQSQVR